MPIRQTFRRQFRAPVRTNKETVDSVSLLVPAGTTTTIDIATAVNDYVGTVGTMPISAKVKAVWIEATYGSNFTTIGRVDWYLARQAPGIGIGSFPVPSATGGDIMRKWIFLERKGLTQGIAAAGGGPTSKVAGWVPVPKLFQNMSEGSKLLIRVGSSEVYSFCLKVIYKWMA